MRGSFDHLVGPEGEGAGERPPDGLGSLEGEEGGGRRGDRAGGGERGGGGVIHSITWSARRRKERGIVSPMVLAALRLIISSNFVGCSTGRSPGLAPLKILLIGWGAPSKVVRTPAPVNENPRP